MNFWIENIIILSGAIMFIFFCISAAKMERWQRARVRFQKDRLGKISLMVLCVYLLFGLLDSIQLSSWSIMGQPLTLLDYIFKNVPLEKSYSAPLAHTAHSIANPEPLLGWHLFGTDALGRDVLLQTLKASRTALIIGGLTSLIYIPLGTGIGIIAGYFKGRVDDLVQYIYSTIASIPEILLLVSILLVLGKGLTQMSIALGVTSWVGLCRLIRGETLRQSGRAYIEAARGLGQSNSRIIINHILPNVMHLVVINFVLGFSGLILAEAILSYLGVGAPFGVASWGVMIDSARMELSREPVVWWNITAATFALFFLVLSLNLVGDALRRAFDPKAI